MGNLLIVITRLKADRRCGDFWGWRANPYQFWKPACNFGVMCNYILIKFLVYKIAIFVIPKL